MSDTIQAMAEKCKASFSIEFNPHKNYYETVLSYMKWNHQEIITEEMEQTDTLVVIIAYVNNPGSSIRVYHHDYETAVAEMQAALEKEKCLT